MIRPGLQWSPRPTEPGNYLAVEQWPAQKTAGEFAKLGPYFTHRFYVAEWNGMSWCDQDGSYIGKPPLVAGPFPEPPYPDDPAVARLITASLGDEPGRRHYVAAMVVLAALMLAVVLLGLYGAVR